MPGWVGFHSGRKRDRDITSKTENTESSSCGLLDCGNTAAQAGDGKCYTDAQEESRTSQSLDAVVSDGACSGAVDSKESSVEQNRDCNMERGRSAVLKQIRDSSMEQDGGVVLEQNRDSNMEQDGGVVLEQIRDSNMEQDRGVVLEQSGDGEEEVDEDSDDDEEGWITPENFQQVCEEMGGALEVEPKGIAVGCITTDFAMQVRMMDYFLLHKSKF